MVNSSTVTHNIPARTRVKVCGITRTQDAITAIQAGADALGFVFYSPSPRAVTADVAAQLCQRLPPFVDKVGLFVNASAAEVQQALKKVPLSLLQFHGDESAAFCEQFGVTYIKAIRMPAGGTDNETETDSSEAVEAYEQAIAQLDSHQAAAGFLLDTYQKGVPGGTGKMFDWSRIPSNLTQAIILAGGLDANNVAAAVKAVAPYAVDVSSGVESSGGIKSPEKIQAFMQAVAGVGV